MLTASWKEADLAYAPTARTKRFSCLCCAKFGSILDCVRPTWLIAFEFRNPTSASTNQENAVWIRWNSELFARQLKSACPNLPSVWKSCSGNISRIDSVLLGTFGRIAGPPEHCAVSRDAPSKHRIASWAACTVCGQARTTWAEQPRAREERKGLKCSQCTAFFQGDHRLELQGSYTRAPTAEQYSAASSSRQQQP